MSWQPYVLSLVVGLGVGAIYGGLNVKAPAPPVIALVGLFGILLGETVVRHIRGQPDAVAQCLHRKDFAHDTPAPNNLPHKQVLDRTST